MVMACHYDCITECLTLFEANIDAYYARLRELEAFAEHRGLVLYMLQVKEKRIDRGAGVVCFELSYDFGDMQKIYAIGDTTEHKKEEGG